MALRRDRFMKFELKPEGTYKYDAVSLGEVLEISSKETMQTLKDMITMRYVK